MNSIDLSSLCDVSRRTIFRDIRELRDSGADIQTGLSGDGYVLAADRSNRISVKLSHKELFSLFVLCHELGDQKRGIPFLEHAQMAAIKLAQSFPEKMIRDLQKTINAVSLNLGPRSEDKTKMPIFEMLLEAVRSDRRIRIHYSTSTVKRTKSTLLSIYKILFYEDHWYAIGRSTAHRNVLAFALREIQSAELLEETFQIPPRFNLDKFLILENPI